MMQRRPYCFFVSVFIALMVHNAARAQERSVMFDSADVTIVKMEWNTTSSEYAPAFCEGGVIFSSNRPHQVAILNSDSITADNLYYVRKRGSAPDFINKINTLQQEGTCSYSSAEGILYYSASIVSNPKQLGIYSSVRSSDGSWSKPVPVLLPTDNSSYFQPCITADGNTMLLVSDKSGAYGGTDLYRSERINGKWSEPVNLGAQINTAGNEGYPSFCSGYLFFSSTAHNSIGGYDNFFCRFDANGIGNVLPVGDRLNSTADDFGMIYDPETRIGYFTSNKDQSTGDDIYMFSLAWPHFTNCVAHVTPRYCYEFSEENSMESDDADLFYYQWNFGDGTIANALTADHCFAGPGNYNVELVIRNRKDSSFFMSQVVYEHEIAEKPGLRINCPDTVFIGDTVSVNSDHSSILGHQIQQYYWDFGDHLFTREQHVTFVPHEPKTISLLLGVSTLGFEPSALDEMPPPSTHYFCTEKNLVVLPASEKQQWIARQLARKKADTVKVSEAPVFDLSRIENPDYAVFIGSSHDSLSFPQKGTDAIVRIVKEGDVYRYLYGSAENMHAVHATYVDLKELGIDSAFVIVLSNDTIVANQISPDRDFVFTDVISQLMADTLPEAAIIPVNVGPLPSDTTFIYFNSNESILNLTNKKRVDSLINTTPGASYRLVAFSDQVGNEAHNLKLSKTRSAAVSDYLVSKDVKRNFITQDAFGEARPAEFRPALKKMKHERCVIIITTPPAKK